MNQFMSILFLILLSILAIFTLHQIHFGIAWIAESHQFILNKLALLFSGDQWGRIIRFSLALIAIPLLLGLIPAFFYWIFKRRWMPYYMVVVWIIWCILITILAYK